MTNRSHQKTEKKGGVHECKNGMEGRMKETLAVIQQEQTCNQHYENLGALVTWCPEFVQTCSTI
jgi:hypothetical protein